MLELYRQILALDPGARNAVLTVIEGKDFGDKCLLSSGALLWERDAGGFFARNLGAIRDVACRREASPDAQLVGCGMLEIDGQRVFCEILGREARLVVCGGGHVAIPLIRIARMLGMPVTVAEDRPAFAENARSAGADRVLCAPFDEALRQIPGDGDTFFVIVTRGHGCDIQCLDAISRKPHAYIGMIGSRRRAALVKRHLRREASPLGRREASPLGRREASPLGRREASPLGRREASPDAQLVGIEERGCDPAVIDAVHMPIGLDIGAETPEEIAVSIMAEIIQVKHRSGRSAFPRELLQAIVDPGQELPMALATVVTRRGSAPRGPGARMLVWPDGRTLGTVGGGIVENGVIHEASRRLQAGETAPCLYTARLDADAVAEDGMACGGEVSVLIEIIGNRE